MHRPVAACLAVCLALTAVAGAVVPVAAATGNDTSSGAIDAEDGGEYEIPATLQFDVEEADALYELRTADERSLVAQFHAEGGHVTLDTASMDPGQYVLMNTDSDEAIVEFSLVDEVQDEAAGDSDAPNSDAIADRPRTTLTDGESYTRSGWLDVAVDDDNRYEVEALFDWSYTLLPERTDDTLHIRTWTLRTGWYAVYDTETDRAVTTFELLETKRPAETASAPEVLSSGPVAGTQTVTATDGGIFWHGQTLRFRVDGDATYRVVDGDGTTVSRTSTTAHWLSLNTTDLDRGEYTLEREDGHDLYTVILVSQSLTAKGGTGSVAVDSNRGRFDVALSSSDLSKVELLDLVPAAIERDGAVVVEDVRAGERIWFDDSTPTGNYSLTVRAVDTGTTSSATMTVPEAGLSARHGSTADLLVGVFSPRNPHPLHVR